MRKQLAAREKKIAGLDKQLVKNQKELGITRDKLSGSERERVAQQLQLQTAQGQLRHERQQLNAKVDELAMLRQQLQAQQIELDKKPEQVIVVEADPETERQLANVQRTLSQREQQINEFDRLLAQTRAQLESTRNDLMQNQRQSQLQHTQLEVTESKLARNRSELENARSELDEKRSELKQRLVTLEKLESQLSDRHEQLNAKSTRVSELELRVRELETEAATREREKTEQLALAQSLMAGPEITLIDPVLPVTRDAGPIVLRSISPTRQIIGRLSAPAGLLSLTVNEAVTEPNNLGVFVKQMNLRPNTTPVSIIAVDNQGKRSALDFAFAMNGGAAKDSTAKKKPAREPLHQQIDFGKLHVLVIGNNDYKSLTDLRTAINDADAVADVLTEKYNAETTVLRNATRYEILSALNDLRGKLTSDDNLIIYYAGHGVLDEVNMRGHWLPVDAEAENTANWISNVSITDMLNVIPAKRVLVISDSCYSGALTRSASPRQSVSKTDRERLNWFRTMAEKRARVVMTSGGLKPVLDSGGGKHSVFSKALLEVLNDNNDILDGRSLYKQVAARVAYAAARVGFDQVPEYAPIRHAGHESGEFFLVPRA